MLRKLIGRLPAPKRASHRILRDAKGEVVDDGIVLWFPGPNSATGEDLVELQIHGSRAVAQKLTKLLSGYGLKPAEAGEFTLRALRHGRIGLLEAEGLGDLLEAETEDQRQQALSSYDGSSRALVEAWREGLIESLAVLEAAVDFPDEEDIPENIASRALPALLRVQRGLSDEISKSAGGQRLREGLTLAIIGPPNAGKSTLLNRLLGEERAIVSDIPGTTRDVVSARLDIGGRVVEVLDTAGLRDATNDPIEKVGIAKSRAAAASADILIEVAVAGSAAEATHPDAIHVATKTDLGGVPDKGSLGLSAKTGEGWDAFHAEVVKRVQAEAAPALFTHERQLALLRAGHEALSKVTTDPAGDPELMAEDVRHVVSLLDQMTGQITPDEVLGAIFSRFCIGK